MFTLLRSSKAELIFKLIHNGFQHNFQMILSDIKFHVCISMCL